MKEGGGILVGDCYMHMHMHMCMHMCTCHVWRVARCGRHNAHGTARGTLPPMLPVPSQPPPPPAMRSRARSRGRCPTRIATRGAESFLVKPRAHLVRVRQRGSGDVRVSEGVFKGVQGLVRVCEGKRSFPLRGTCAPFRIAGGGGSRRQRAARRACRAPHRATHVHAR